MALACLTLALAAGTLPGQIPAPAAPPSAPAAAPGLTGPLARDVIWGVKAGYASASSAWFDGEVEIGIDGGYTVGGFVDYRLAPKLFGGVAVHLTSLSGDLDVDPLKDVTMVLKGLVGGGPTAQFAFRPGLGFGFGSDGDAKYLVLHTFVELVPARSPRPWVGDVGLIFAPAGGNDEYDITLEPRLVLRFGKLF